MPTEVVDIHKMHGKQPEYDVYIGRAVQYHPEYKPSKWANLYTFKQYGPAALELYEMDLREKIRTYPEIYNLRELVGLRLGCWCLTTSKVTPCHCHGQILMKLIKEFGLE